MAPTKIIQEKCKFCEKDFNNRGSLVSHEKRCVKNPSKVVFGKSNQFIKAEKEGRPKPNHSPGLRKPGRPQTEETKEKLRKLNLGHRGYAHTPESKSKLSEARSKAIENSGKGGFIRVKYYRVMNITGEWFFVRGLWEKGYAEYLNTRGILWIRKVYLKYTTEDQVIRTYTPDFFIPEINQYVEVKGFYGDRDKEKIRLVEVQNNLKIQILFKKDLENLGVSLK